MIAVTVHGAEGRMGRLVTELIEATGDLALCGLVTEVGHDSPAGDFHPRLPLTPQDRLPEIHPRGGVIVDFSLPTALAGLLAGGAAADAPLVIGTTGHDESQMEMLRRYADERVVVLVTNFSIGIPVLKLVLEQLATLLPEGFMPEQIETHHRHKIDRPSGTARSLALAWEAKRGGGKVPTHSVRVGGVTGEHSWIISDDEETLVVTHRAHSRRAFLRGIVPAVRFAARGTPGLYTLEDILAGGA
ncbi:4-hydroxy-tetrahydrodipicolinate reductase [bacterium]|nr:4-hydroxy-tetrahydrodipicolinate reductase [bacterium]MBU1072554.1 4-hydroxy-tetrahydrodipicolinate reductase [bacterium]MBU1674176.1 4-hydroxy-tetrahydrodipicolinate reductase [bacterium]